MLALNKSKCWFLLPDSAPSHNATTAQQFLDNRKFAELRYALYSPDLAATSNFLFPKLRFDLKDQHFQSITECKAAVTRELITIIKETCLAGKKLCEHADECHESRRSVCWRKIMIFFKTCIFVFFFFLQFLS